MREKEKKKTTAIQIYSVLIKPTFSQADCCQQTYGTILKEVQKANLVSYVPFFYKQENV